MPTTDNLALLTDLYQLTMAQGYFQSQQPGAGDFQSFYPVLSSESQLLRFRGPARCLGVP